MLQDAPIVRVSVEGRPMVMLIDTGSCILLIQPGISAAIITQANVIWSEGR